MNRNPKARIPEAVRDPLGPPMPGWGWGWGRSQVWSAGPGEDVLVGGQDAR